MINSKAFTDRLRKIMEYYSISASGLAEKIDVQRSSISHILSGRNKPSLEFVMKVLSSFPEVDLYWLLNGKGDFPSKSDNSVEDQPSFSSNTIQKNKDNDSDIERIVIFYKDGSFKDYFKN